MMHGDALEINNVIQEKPYKPIDSMEVVLSHSGLSSSQLESAYSIEQLTHLHYNYVYLSKDSRLLLPLISICVFGDVKSIEPVEGGVLTPSSTIRFTMKSVTPLPTVFHLPSSASRYLHALQYSTNQSDIGNEAVRVHGLMVFTLFISYIQVIGGPGSGKSSLLKYFCNQLHSSLYLSSDSFPYSDPFSVIECLSSLQLLCIDDIDELSEGLC